MAQKCESVSARAKRPTKPDHGDEDKADTLDDQVQPPVEQIFAEFLSGQLQPTDEEDDGHGAIENAVL